MAGHIRRKVEVVDWILYIQCTKCLQIKDYTHFYTTKSSLWYRWVCKECEKIKRQENKEFLHDKMKKYYREHKEERRKYNREYRLRNKEKLKRYDKQKREKKWYVKIHNKTISFVRAMGLSLNKCCLCGGTNKIELHHPDYNKWYEVVVVCNWCHKEIHSWYKSCPTTINLLDFNK